MHKTHAKRRRDIKNKLMAAICMLLVSSIMMVSTTYAWFTLSTAPEVTGINTAVGANGNLEIALMPKDGQTSSITSAAGDSLLAIEQKNVTWGNLVDLSDSSVYGLDSITLYPADLNRIGNDTDGYLQTIGTTLLKTPTYGSDGRVATLNANTSNGYYDATEKNFFPNNDLGVRAVGTASGMSERQLAYRNARSAASTAAAAAKTVASQSLNANGSALANIAIKKATSDNAEYTMEDLESLQTIVNDLLGTDSKRGALQNIETAYKQYILAYAASSAVKTVMVKGEDGADVESDAQPWQSVDVSKGLDEILDSLPEGVSLPSGLTTPIDSYFDTVEKVQQAESLLEELMRDGSEPYSWADISGVLTLLANPDTMQVNGYATKDLMANISDVVSSAMSGGLRVTMESQGGVYADIADHCGDYTASVLIEEISYGGVGVKNMAAKMETNSKVSPSYLNLVNTAVDEAGAPASSNSANQPITDMYGYVIDLAFRTNAAESNLLLQQDAVDRIYSDNANEGTMGHGSNMTFTMVNSDLSETQIAELLKAIRLVFFTPGDGNNTVILCAKLDVEIIEQSVGEGESAQIVKTVKRDADGNVVANLILYKEKTVGGTAESYQLAEDTSDTTKTYYTRTGDSEETYEYTAVTGELDPEGIYYVKVAATSGGVTEVLIEDDVIMPLTQNVAHQLSVLVYLDGNLIGNDDVAASAATSMVGKLNLQFASSATLVPMDYSQLHTPNTAAGDGSGNNGGAQTPENGGENGGT